MCGRYTLRRADLAKAAFDALLEESFEEFSERPHFNIAPSQDIPLVRLNKNGERSLGLVRWGLIPHWAKGQPPKVQPINARAETVTTSGMFKQAFLRRRCIIPADGFYEWRRAGKAKQPMFVHFPDNHIFGFAGLWERWRPAADAEPVDTCTIITTTPNTLMSPIHDRMPVILRPEDYGRWLDKETDPAETAKLMKPYPDGEMEAVPVSKLVNSPGNDTPECVAPVAAE